MSVLRHVKLFRNGRNQALRIPKELELEGNEATIRKEGNSLIIEPVRKINLLALLDSWDTLEEEFPDVDVGLPPADDISL